LPLSRTLLEEYEENRQNQADKGGEVVPLDGLSFEDKHHYDGKDCQ
jgi:hypothetical protein